MKKLILYPFQVLLTLAFSFIVIQGIFLFLCSLNRLISHLWSNSNAIINWLIY